MEFHWFWWFPIDFHWFLLFSIYFHWFLWFFIELGPPPPNKKTKKKKTGHEMPFSLFFFSVFSRQKTVSKWPTRHPSAETKAERSGTKRRGTKCILLQYGAWIWELSGGKANRRKRHARNLSQETRGKAHTTEAASRHPRWYWWGQLFWPADFKDRWYQAKLFHNCFFPVPKILLKR